MNRINLFTALFLCLIGTRIPGYAQDRGNWLNLSVKAKAEVQTKLKKQGMPVVSRWIKAKETAEPFGANVKDQDCLVLITKGGNDGNSYDHAVWANARLITADGTSVWLDELDYEFGTCDYYGPFKNINMLESGITIAGKSYEHGMTCHADGVMIYRLDKKYVRFEAEVGLDDNSNNGSVYFYALNVYPKELSQTFTTKHPNEALSISTLVGDIGDWMTESGTQVERNAIREVVAKLKQPGYYSEKLKQLDNEASDDTDSQEHEKACLLLLKEVRDVLALQVQLEWLNVPAVKQAFEDMKGTAGYNVTLCQMQLARLEKLTAGGFTGIYRGEANALANAREALDCKRNILLSNPLLDCDRIIAARYKVGGAARNIMAPSLGTQSNNWTNQESAPRSGFDAEIVELSDLRGNVQTRTIYKPKNGSSISDLRMHWNADRVMFSQIQEDGRWNVFEIKLDGSGFHRILENEEPDLEFYDGTYLPNGCILAISNIGYQGVPCVNGSDAVGNLVLYNPQNKNLRRLTFDQDANWNPVVMNNGRVMYTRWEYTDLTHYYTRIVMHMNPDGTENKALYGSGSMFPNSTFDIQPIPGHGSAFVGIISGHHGVARSGRLMVFDPAKGRKGTAGIVQEIPYRNRSVKELIKDELVNDVWPQFVKPTVLNDKYFLVTAKLTPESLWGIYLVDVFDNVTCIMETEGEGFISPILAKESPVPPVIPNRVKLEEKEATFFIQDIYEGEGMRGIPRGTVKELRLHAYEYAYVQTTSDHNWHGIQSGWDIKRQLGTVPVEEDGSAIFKVPANTPISIQPIDKDGVAIQWMRSWVTGQPGEMVSCIGCHEDQNQIPIPKRTIASQKTASRLTPPEGGVRSFTFDLEIQPILDRNCVSCHNGERKAFDLRGGKKDKMGYGTSYLNLHPYVHRQGGEGDMVVLQPYEYHPNTSELIRILKKGHYNVELTDKEWRKLYNWIDYNAPDKGYFNANVLTSFPYKGFDQIDRRMELANKYGNGAGVNWKKEIANYAEYLKTQGPVQPVEPKPVCAAKGKEVKAKEWPFSADEAKKQQQAEGARSREVEIAPGIKVNFIRIPSGQFVMGSANGESDARPQTKVKIEKAFWMAELETTNQQYNVIFPEHDSRFVDQLWKDHVIQGYPANQPEQPVIRVSYNDAMEYCRQLSEKTGLNITLPTEAQWEWACRAGSDNDFWYGDRNADFGRKENLADKTTLKFAVQGLDPQPMSPNDFWYKYYTYLPKEESVDDGNLIQIGGKVYEANPFGLYCMQGNVAEWTRSDYLPYPYKEKSSGTSEFKVVRGGSYIERPKYSTAHTRKAFYPYQRVFNVGFRMIIEE